MDKALAIDIGNTRIKAGVFEGDELIDVKAIDYASINELHDVAETYGVKRAIVSSVSLDAAAVVKVLRAIPAVLTVDAQTVIPFKNAYSTPETLGVDRIAAIAAACVRNPGVNSLVIDCGTCITYDFIDSTATYLGGAISPGINLRLKAMNDYTDRLPLPDFRIPETFVGNSTENALLSGVFFGVLSEIDGAIDHYRQQFGSIKTIICGGDALLFEKHLKNNIFAAPDLVLEGLNQILQINHA